jgi:tRNA nucleotidyltransferase/poly(A) polymerase
MASRPSSLAGLLEPGSPVARVAAAFADAGHELYLVGGPVRDIFLKRDRRDLDFATDAPPEKTRVILEPLASALWLQGMKFGTVGAVVDGEEFEITTFRTERYEPRSRHPEVTFEATISSDLSRRDFTINAMAVRLPELAPVDPFSGLDDLKRRVLRTPIDPKSSFTDDPLRMLRAFRFASQLDFSIDRATLDAIEELSEEITTISAERIRDELTRLVVGKGPGRALEGAERTGLTRHFLPELGALKLEQDPVHRHKDVFHHTYRLGWTDSAVRRYVRDAGELLGDLNRLVRADCTTRNVEKARRLAQRMDELERRIAEVAQREEIARIRPELDGRQVMAYLGVEPGPIVGRALDHLLEIRLDEGLLGEDEIYRRLDEWARAQGIEPGGRRIPPKAPKRPDDG